MIDWISTVDVTSFDSGRQTLLCLTRDVNQEEYLTQSEIKELVEAYPDFVKAASTKMLLSSQSFTSLLTMGVRRNEIFPITVKG